MFAKVLVRKGFWRRGRDSYFNLVNGAYSGNRNPMVRSRSRGRKPAKQVEGQEQVKGKGGLLALHSQGKQAYRRRGKHKHHEGSTNITLLFLPWFLQ